MSPTPVPAQEPPPPRATLAYRLLYRLGVTPWDTGWVPPELASLVEGPGAPAPGRSLDLGCGTGTLSIYLARRGWQATGVDFVPRALEVARRRAGSGGLSPRWLCGDVTRLDTLDLGAPFDLLLDFGCYHGLGEEERAAYAAGVQAVAAPGAAFLLYAFSPGRRAPLPRGAGRAEVESRFGAHWDLIGAQAQGVRHLPAPLRATRPTLYRLRRR